MGILEAHRSSDIEVTPAMLAAWSVKAETDTQVNRLVEEARVCVALGQIPRRLGADATPKQLARDKVLARRMTHAMVRLAVLWGTSGLAPVAATRLVHRAHQLQPAHRQAGAQRMWGEWDEQHHAFLKLEITRVATLALAAGQRSFGNKAVHLLIKEQESVTYAQR